MKRLKVLSLAALVAFAACDEGSDPITVPEVTGTISGVVTIEGTARSGVSVTLSSGAAATTDASGAYSFAGVKAGTYTITISGFPTDAAFSTTTKGATIATSGQVQTVNFDGAYVRTSAILGSVLAGSRGLAGVKVALTGSNTAGASVNTDANGQYAFTGLRAGSYTVTISGFDAGQYTFASSTATVTVAAGQSQVASFTGTLLATAKITGTVTIEGAPAAGVGVALSGNATASTTTDAAGAYTFSGLTVGSYNVTISGFAADAQFTEITKAVTIGSASSTGTASFTGAYIKTAMVTGSVAVGGVGQAGVTVSLTGSATATTTTDSDGQYKFTALRGGSYSVTISNWDALKYTFATTSQGPFTVATGGAEVKSFAGARATNATISGYAFIDENPATLAFEGAEEALKTAGIKITLTSDAGTQTAETDANGMFKFENLAWGTYGVQIDTADTDKPANVNYKQAFNSTQVVVVAPASTGTVNFPFQITRQTIKVKAMLGFDASVSATGPTGVAPIQGAGIRLYDTYANALANGGTSATGMIGSGTTDANGEVAMRFNRSVDVGPAGSTSNDKLVYALIRQGVAPALNGLPSYSLNGESVIEIAYAGKDSVTTAPDFFDATNTAIVVKLSAAEIDNDPVAVWRWDVRANKDSIPVAPVWAYTPFTDADGMTVFNVTLAGNVGSSGTFPDTLWFRLNPGGAQPNANGHGFVQTPTAVKGTAAGRWLRYIWNGTVATTDTIDIGSMAVKYTDSDIFLKIHHEVDDSLTYTGGDDLLGTNGVNAQLYTRNAAGTYVATGAATAFGGITPGMLESTTYPSLGNVSTAGSYRVKAIPTGARTIISDTLITFTLDGGDQVDTVNVVGGSAGESTFAFKFNNTRLSGVTVADDGTVVNGMKVRIQAVNNLGTTYDSTVTVGKTAPFAADLAGWFTTRDNLLEGNYQITIADDSTNWEFTRTLRMTTSSTNIGGRYMASASSLGRLPAGTLKAANPGASGSTAVDNDGPTQGSRRLAGSGDHQYVNFLATRVDGRIRGLVVNDRDNDGNTVDAGEALAGVLFQLYKDNAGTTASISNDSLVAEGETSGSGVFDFTGLREGRYILRKVNSTPAGQAVSVTGDVRWVPTDTVIVQIAANATCAGGDLCRTVGSTSGYTGAAGFKLPAWDYAGTAVPYTGTLNRVAAVDGIRRTNFSFLYQNGTVNGTVTKAGSASNAAGLTMVLQLCQTTNWVLARLPVAQGWNTSSCTPGAFSASTIVSSTGTYSFANLQEGVYRVNVSGVPTREGFLWVLGSGDVQTVPVLAEP